MPVQIHFKDIPEFKVSKAVPAWMEKIYGHYSDKTLICRVILSSDEALHELNLQYLKHDTLTDVLTFAIDESDKALESEIYISMDRVRENATKFDEDVDRELRRVMVHGILHLAGYTDQTKADKDAMREVEEKWLNISSD